VTSCLRFSLTKQRVEFVISIAAVALGMLTSQWMFVPELRTRIMAKYMTIVIGG